MRPRDPKVPEKEHEYNKKREKDLNPKVLRAVSLMYQQSIELSKIYHDEFRHVVYITPVFFMRTFRIFTRLLEERK